MTTTTEAAAWGLPWLLVDLQESMPPICISIESTLYTFKRLRAEMQLYQCSMLHNSTCTSWYNAYTTNLPTSTLERLLSLDLVNGPL